LYADRYDYRANLIDWDYQRGIKPFGPIVHAKQYRYSLRLACSTPRSSMSNRDWRLAGIAFEFGDQTYTHPNKTMASFAEVSHRGVR
jgi:dynein assembly factor 3